MSKLEGVEGIADRVEVEELVDREDTGSEESLSGNEGSEGYTKPPSKPRSKERIPPPVPLCEGQIYFSTRFHVKLKKSQQETLGAHSVGTKNKCRKSRPWVIVEVLGHGHALAMCSTTREKKTWSGVTKETAGSFLPISPTESKFERPVVHLADDVRNIFTGFSLLFLEIQQEIKVELLEDYIGSLTEEGLATLRDQRKRWENSGKVAPSEHSGKGEEYDDEDDEDDDGGEDEGEDDGCRGVDGGWTLVTHRKGPHCTRGRGGRGNRGRGNCRGFSNYRHSNGGRKAHI